MVIMYHTFFRQSNLAAPTSNEFDYTWQLTRDDVRICDHCVVVIHKWSKRHQSATHQAEVVIPAVLGSILCPREAVRDMVHAIPTRYPNQPFLIFNDGSHMPLPYLRKIWSTVLRAIRVTNHQAYTLHGLLAATHVYDQDLSARDEIKAHRLWCSDRVDRYLPSKQTKVFKCHSH